MSCESAKLIEFTNPDSPLCIIDELQNSGYPHIEITENNKRYAYECCLVNEVITKRLPALDDMRKGIGEVNVMGITLLFLLEDFPEIRARVFPGFENHVSAKDLRRHLVFEDSSNSKSAQAKHWFNLYIDELDQRGMFSHTHLKLGDILFLLLSLYNIACALFCFVCSTFANLFYRQGQWPKESF